MITWEGLRIALFIWLVVALAVALVAAASMARADRKNRPPDDEELG